MIFILERVTQPALEPVTLAEAKRHLRCFDSVTSEDSDITGLITGARQWVEDFTGRALIDQTWQLTIDQARRVQDVPADAVGRYCNTFQWARSKEIMLRRSPVLEIVSVVSVDSAGVETAVDEDAYELREPDSKWPRLVALGGAIWADVLRITFRAGFADQEIEYPEGSEVVPVCLTQAMKFWIEAMYDRDEKMMPMLLKTAENILKSEQTNLQIA